MNAFICAEINGGYVDEKKKIEIQELYSCKCIQTRMAEYRNGM